MLQGINIKRTFRTGKESLEVLKGIDIVIEKGELYTIVGPSGAGKSTLIHIIGGLDAPTEGKVILESNNLYDFPDQELARVRNKKIGFIFQFHHLLPEFSALENVMIPSIINGIGSRNAKERARNLLNKVALSDRLRHKPNQLSGGEKQRVAVARALVNNPSIIFADEPTGNLDRKNSDMLLEMLLGLNQNEGITIVLVTHNEDIARRVGNIIKLEDGRIQESLP
ncbi:MAG: ABC transporter ATP-binding protein [Candidatus Cloacimonadota bacterium]|nr:MAG: ABC transporter ATP-binding protein [Candidatus Cloacimonadota bacterium]